MEGIEAYIDPELAILIPALCLVGTAIKRSKVDDEFIPVLLGGLGMILGILYEVATLPAGGSVPMAVFTGILQGIFCAAASVYAHQVYKQGRKLGE